MKTLILPLLLLGPAFPGFSLEADLVIMTGLETGITQELVFEGEKMLSRLDWQDRAVPTVGFAARIALRGFFLGLGTSFAIPVRSGEMENRDFLLPSGPEASHYSRHEVYLDKDFSADARAGYRFDLGSFFVEPSLGFRYDNRKWTATGGFLQYPGFSLPWTGSEPEVALSGPIISYEQAIRFPFAGLEVGFGRTFLGGNRFFVAAGAALFPRVKVDAADVHFMRNIRFYDSLAGGPGLSINLSGGYFPHGANGPGFVVRADRELVSGLRGTTSQVPTGISDGNPVLSDGYGAGTQIDRWHFSLGMSVPLYRKVCTLRKSPYPNNIPRH